MNSGAGFLLGGHYPESAAAMQAAALHFSDVCETMITALVQTATGSGKNFTAITEVHLLLKFAGARRVLFVVDTRNLWEQAEQEFMSSVQRRREVAAKNGRRRTGRWVCAGRDASSGSCLP